MVKVVKFFGQVVKWRLDIFLVFLGRKMEFNNKNPRNRQKGEVSPLGIERWSTEGNVAWLWWPSRNYGYILVGDIKSQNSKIFPDSRLSNRWSIETFKNAGTKLLTWCAARIRARLNTIRPKRKNFTYKALVGFFLFCIFVTMYIYIYVMILGFLCFIQTFLKHCKALSTEKYKR